MTTNLLKVVIFTSVPPRQVARIVARISRDAAGSQIVGVLYERRPAKTLAMRARIWRKKMKRFVYWLYLIHRIFAQLERRANAFLDNVICFVHASSKWPNGKPDYDLQDLESQCQASGIHLLITPDIHSETALRFAEGLGADIGLIFGTRILKPALFEIPKQGSINIHKRKVPDYRGGGAVGLWELLDNQTEIGVTVHRVESKVDVGAVIRSALIPIDPFDDLESLALKADVVGADLIVAALRDFANGTVTETPQTGPSKLFRSPSAEDLLQLKKRISKARKGAPNNFRRPPWKLLAKSLVHGLPLAIRNRRYRRRAEYPVMILYHHLVSDRPHRFGVSTAYFLRQVNYLLRHYRVVSLSDAVQMIRNGPITMPTIAITFDDGYYDNFVNLRAVTEETGIPIAYFISTEHISSGREFAHDQLFKEHGFAPNNWDQIKHLQQCGFEIGSHTRNHADCGTTDEKLLREEIIGSGADIEQHLKPAAHFSFPFGLPENISAAAAVIACSAYNNVFSAYRGGNFIADKRRILKRANFPHTLWELELQLQSILTGEAEEPSHLKLQVEAREAHIGRSCR
jgi:peptidoglycan/xylan/chitin deacetylase (PgdA/CDA1 family)